MTTINAAPQAVVQSGPGEESVARPAPRRRTPRSIIGKIVLWVVLIAFALAFLYPFAWLLSATFKPRGDVLDNLLIPEHFTLDNYVQVWQKLPLISWLWNSIYIALLAAGLVTISSSLVAFGFAYFRFPFRNTLFGLVLGTMMLPGAVTMVPIYLIWKDLGAIGTTIPLWGANLFGSAFYIFLQRQFFMGLPRELFEAARIDGCTYFGLFRRIAVPLSIPSFIIVFIFEFQASWNNLQAPLIYLNFGSPEQFTVPLGISYAMTLFSPTAGGQGDYQWVVTAALLVTLPMLIIFTMGQKYFIEGIATQGRKG